MLHGRLPMMRYGSLAEGIARGRQQLARMTGRDFGYDLMAWHNHLVESNVGGYRSAGRHGGYPDAIQRALGNREWQAAVRLAEAESLFEKLNERDARQRDAIDRADRAWAGKPRSCPRCGTEFTSVQDRGQCTKCSHIFCASHPESGSSTWWLEIT